MANATELANIEHRTAPETPDFHFHNEGTIGLLIPQTEAARQWVDDFLPNDAQWFGGGIVIEHRYVGDILFAIHNDGLTFIQPGVRR